MSKKIRVGVIGVGHMGKNHARIFSELDRAELVGVHDIDTRLGEKIASKYGTSFWPDLDKLAKEVEAFSIVTPTTFHYEIGISLLNKGKHLLIEKPITTTTEQATELVELANSNGLVLQVGHVERYNPVLDALEERLAHPRFIEAHRLSSYPDRSTDIGVVMDLMIHDLEVILHLVNSSVASIDAVGIPVLSSSEDIANARIKFENGCVANITTSRISPEKMRKIRIFQDDAYISLDYYAQKGEIYRKSENKILRDSIPILKEEPLLRQLDDFLLCILAKGKPKVSGDHATRALETAAKICDQIWSNSCQVLESEL
ncbi:MAG: Gfo/Idh/MocA family oxidoreductase [Verrucomicrobiota bacterium]